MKYRLTVTLILGCAAQALRADTEVLLLNVPDYRWYAGCFGTASGNLIGFWDRSGLSGFYTGPTGGGIAPMNSHGTNAGIQSLWASKAGVDGRPADQPGHIDDYWVRYNGNYDYSYEDTGPDPYVLAGRPEHAPDCIGDFMGLSQRKWTNMNGECSGNIDAYSFVFWETNGFRRTNFQPTNETGAPVPDIPSGLRASAQHRGYDAEVYSQLTDFNPPCPQGEGSPLPISRPRSTRDIRSSFFYSITLRFHGTSSASQMRIQSFTACWFTVFPSTLASDCSMPIIERAAATATVISARGPATGGGAEDRCAA